MPTTRLALWFLLTWLSDAADIAEGGIQAELEANQNNLTALRTITAPPWVSEPSFRGTTSILWSCLVTLLACIYTAIHLNVPTETGTMRRLLQKTKWVLTALIAPEIVLYCASYQFIEARRLVRVLNDLEKEKENGGIPKHTFDLKYGFFVVMGGFEVSVSEIYDDTEKMSLRPNGVIQLAKLGYTLNVSEASIDDKGKANLVQKSLVMLQVTWMATQCITRRAYGFPLTLLEIHTMVHVVCALVMYFFWFYKPLDISEPQHFDSTAFNDILALMVLEQFCKLEAEHIMIYPPWSAATQASSPAVEYVPVDGIKPHDPEPQAQTENKMVDLVTLEQSGLCTVKPGQALKCGFGYIRKWLDNEDEDEGIIKLSRKGVARWERASMAIARLDGQKTASEPFRPVTYMPRYRHEHFDESLQMHANNLDLLVLDMEFDDIVEMLWRNPVLFILLIVLPAVYGGIHLTAWDLEFPSGIERLMWKLSCLDIIITMVVIVVILWVTFGWFEAGGEFVISTVFGFCSLLLVMYALSRIFLVVESFISLRKVPIGVYWTPSWLQTIPHV